ncbi:DUF429 domain-containing protein [Actinopolymorpha sp. NPDC004070]|uniref:DUF429 domain-containing protein n=1 Tax=Actinopolymorpha sp. NPDC004070 TaxID=3154548 RepID=UPI0033A000E2
MLTVGVDLAAEPAKTAVAWIDWSPEGASVRRLVVGADDALVLEALRAADKAGIDCPFGWPEPFVEFVKAHHAGDVADPREFAGRDGRRRLALRTTDIFTYDTTGLLPLSVSADRIGHTAMRCAGLLAHLAQDGQSVDRSGAGAVVEVYPAASLKKWGLPSRGYKRARNVDNLRASVEALLAAAPWLQLGQWEDECRRSDDAFDAVIAAMTARAVSRGLVEPLPEKHASVARTEGWIALPSTSIDALHN